MRATTLLAALVPAIYGATIFPDEPKPTVPQIAIDRCIDGSITVRYRKIGEAIEVVQVVDTSEGKVYSLGFEDFFARYYEFWAKTGRWKDPTISADGTYSLTFVIDPCNDEKSSMPNHG